MKNFILLALASLVISGCTTPPPTVDTEWKNAKSTDAERRAIEEQRIADLKEKDLATFRRLFAGAKTLSLRETNVTGSDHKEEWLTKHPLDRNQLKAILDAAGLTLAESNADVAMWIEYKAVPEGSLYEYGDIRLLSGEKKFAGECYFGAFVSGSVCVGSLTARMCTRFFASDKMFAGGTCPRNPKDAPYFYAFNESGLKDQLVYLLTQFKGSNWTKQIPPESFTRLFGAGWVRRGNKQKQYDHENAKKKARKHKYTTRWSWDLRLVVTGDERERTTPE